MVAERSRRRRSVDRNQKKEKGFIPTYVAIRIVSQTASILFLSLHVRFSSIVTWLHWIFQIRVRKEESRMVGRHEKTHQIRFPLTVCSFLWSSPKVNWKVKTWCLCGCFFRYGRIWDEYALRSWFEAWTWRLLSFLINLLKSLWEDEDLRM